MVLPASKVVMYDQKGCSDTARLSEALTRLPSDSTMYVEPMVTTFRMEMPPRLLASCVITFWQLSESTHVSS